MNLLSLSCAFVYCTPCWQSGEDLVRLNLTNERPVQVCQDDCRRWRLTGGGFFHLLTSRTLVTVTTAVVVFRLMI